MNTADLLNITTSICPDKVALIFEGKEYTFKQLNERVTRLGNALLKLGVRKGDRVAMMQVNCNQYVEAYFATAKIGAIFVPLNFRAKGNELIYMLNFAEADTLFIGERYIELINQIRPKLDSVKTNISIERPCDGMLYYDDLIATSPADEIISDAKENDTTLLIYTAGTTGCPKGVILSHNSFTIYSLNNVEPPDPTVEERNLLAVPLYHVAGVQAMIAAMYGGRTLVIQRQYDPTEWMELVQREKVSRAMMVPTMLKHLMEHPDFGKYDLSSLKVITYGAEIMPLEVIKKAVEIFPKVSFINAFGQTETAATITMLSPEDHIISGTKKEKERKLKRLCSVGRSLPDVEIKIIDEEGNEVPAGQVGEIAAKGPRIMDGYWKDQNNTIKTIDNNGWVHTGDRGYKDEDGYLFLVGRVTDLIKRGGENIAPEEIEAVLQSHPKVDQAAVFGVSDEKWGEVPMCVVILKKGQAATPDELIEHCHSLLASFKKPKAVAFVNEIPRNPMGKVLRRVLREKYDKKKTHAK